MAERVLSFEEALQEVLTAAGELAGSGATEQLPLVQAAGRVLAEEVAAPRDQPPFARSTRDGFAVRAEDVRPGAALRVLGTVRAGERWVGDAVNVGEAVEIMTGAPLPAGAEAVLMVEHVRMTGGEVIVGEGRTLRTGENVVPRGAEAARGTTVLGAGQVLDAGTIALAASCGRPELEVYRRPVVAIIATGDELVELGQQPEEWEIFNSNSHALSVLVAQAGGEPQRLKVARDRMEDLRERLVQAQDADLVLLSGGVSMGKFDLVELALREADAEFAFTGARIQPGKPVVFGRIPRRAERSEIRDQRPGGDEWLYFFGLPGNPVSTEVCFHLFVAPLLRTMGGRLEPGPTFVEAQVAERFSGKPGLLRFLPARLQSDVRGVTVRPVSWQGSGDLAANARANAYCVVPEAGVATGEHARVLLR